MAPARSERNRKPYARPRASDAAWVHDRAPLTSVPAQKHNPVVNGNTLNTRLVVSNLHYEVTPKDLMSIFGQIGTLVREPLIRYDRSGRSSGVAIVFFETSADATRAKNQFDGILAKGQPMEIAFDNTPPRRVRSTSMPGLSTSSLLSRIEKPSLAERLAGSNDEKRSHGGLVFYPFERPQGTSRVVRSGPARTRGAPRSKVAAPKAKAARPARAQPKTAEELDKELDVFMGDDKTASGKESASEVVAATVEDVEMA
ncbi:hypothetical protein BJ138DRAFT_1002621 [Hygrophoropsis aurantiaca]|uniref:Uncharacterized protein n=1 Tax=Hygrophoropsis aurantiaca TaxID=72124 RepID=A0ACB8AK49_9AGAM|nr:hypothetical protein BJ138DRAFT_1002621 [Hygrophoropsis aurantiaca]